MCLPLFSLSISQTCLGPMCYVHLLRCPFRRHLPNPPFSIFVYFEALSTKAICCHDISQHQWVLPLNTVQCLSYLSFGLKHSIIIRHLSMHFSVVLHQNNNNIIFIAPPLICGENTGYHMYVTGKIII